MPRAESEAPGRCEFDRSEIKRARIAAWFDATLAVAVRLVAAPVGAGKTFAVKQYAARNPGRVTYVTVPPGAGRHALQQLVAENAADEIILDGADRADPQAYAEMVEDISQGRVAARLIVVGRSRRQLGAHALLAHGLASAYHAADLAFDAQEIAQLADVCGVEYDAHDVAQLLHDTEGWPVAVRWLVRDAAQNHRSLRDAFAHWRERNGHLLLEFVASQRHEDANAFAAFERVLAAGGDGERIELDRLEQIGLPLVRTRSGVQPYRILARLSAPDKVVAPDRISRDVPRLMMLNVLGRVRCDIGGQPLTFARRRDEHVFVFVALAPEGRTTRDRLLDAFWPDTDRRVAAQGLRTTLSRIRRSIAEAAPGTDPNRYFDTAGDIRLDLTAIAVDARRFVEHVEQGRLDDALGAIDAAKHHYRSAHRLYGDRLLALEAPEECFAADAESLARHYVFTLTRLTELHAALGDIEVARHYASELISTNTKDARRSARNVFAAVGVASA
jgi:DNA-binding SARP family transcriptional activator